MNILEERIATNIRNNVIMHGFTIWLAEHLDDPSTVTFNLEGYYAALTNERPGTVSFNDITKPIDEQTYLGLKVRIDLAQAELFKVS